MTQRNLLLLLAALFFISVSYGQTNKSTSQMPHSKSIAVIYIHHDHIFQPCVEFKIDLQNRKLWAYDGYHNWTCVRRNTTSANEGFVFVKDLADDKIKAFLQEAQKYGLSEWKSSYVNPEIDGGHQWGISITYADGTVQQVQGSNRYPETWSQMNAALKALTDKDILILR
ncbi:MAG: hypothetical protein FWD64_14040 [Acidobacteriaceae bacterium]|nr:hypothetical protein [Acidobacteriaceae bacterium]